MKIGIDAGALAVFDKRLHVGVYYITKYLIEYLLSHDKKNTYRLYSFAPITQSITIPKSPHVKSIVLRPSYGYMRVRLPIELTLRPVDVFLGVSQTIPVSKAGGIGFIYDLGFLEMPEGYKDSYAKIKQQTEFVAHTSDHIITISEYTKKQVIDTYHIPSKKISVVYLGVDPAFSPKGKIYKHKHPYILFVGSLKKQKNIPTLLTAFAEFSKRVKTPYDLLLIGGNFWEDYDIKQTIKNHSLESSVYILGAKEQSELPSYYRGATMFCSPSLIEGFCMPVAEAMASGCPVIVSDRGALPEVVGDAGIVVPAMDAKRLSLAMETIATEPATRVSMIQVGLTQAKKYTWNTFGASVLQVIYEVH
jgi:glycosyltransferase involved in cell wall biosynthesis